MARTRCTHHVPLSGEGARVTVECRREIDVPSEMPTVIDRLCELSARERRAARNPLPPGTVVEYGASLELFDVDATGRGLAVWIGALPVPDLDGLTVRGYRDAAFADFLEQLRREWSLQRVS